MTSQVSSRRATRRAVLFIACMGALSGNAAFAQDAPKDDADKPAADSAKLDTITVTGTRISNPNVISPTPISVITADDIKAVGAVNIGDILTRSPQLATTFTMGNSGQGQIGTAGLGLQDLRNLGPQRTLVLVNGRRYVSSSTDTAAVDTNLIPADWVERVEIITGGASAIYGADAVSGVINFILKKQYQGVNLHAQFGTTSPGGQKTEFVSATAGSNFAEDRGNIAFSLEHSRQDELMFHDRFGDQQFASILSPGTPYTRTLRPNAGSYTITPGGTFFIGDDPTANGQRYVFDPDGSVRPQRFDGLFDSSRCQDCDYLPTNQVTQLQPEYKRTTLSVNANFDFTPTNRIYFEGAFTSISSLSRFQPAFGSALNGIGFAGGGYAIAPDNAYIRPDLASIIQANNLSEIDISRFDVDTGGRNEDTTRDTGRIVIGLSGAFGDSDWEYDGSLNYGNTRSTVANTNDRIIERFFASIDAVRDPATGNIVCRSTIDPTSININTGAPISAFGREGCVPTSIFGDGAVNPAARAFFNATTFTRNKLYETVASGTITNNNLFAVPTGAGSASLVAGVEYRKEHIDQSNDPLDQSGATFGNAIPNFSGEYDVKEGFLEFGLPILSDRPFFKDLSVDAAVRESDYDTIGNTQTWKYGLNWSFDENVKMRGTMSYAVRAPNINELFSGAQNFFSVTDPCSASRIPNAPNPGVRAANCASLGVPPGSEIDPPSSVPGFSGGNPNLEAENAKTYTFGFVLTPQFLDRFGFSVDYWNIKLGNAIASIDAQDIVDKCVDAVSGIGNVYCGSVQRDPTTHRLIFIQQQNLNIAGTNTSGIDFQVTYGQDLGPGKLRLAVNATRTIAYTSFPFIDDPSQAEEDNGTDGFPEWKATLGANYSLDRWAFDWNMRYFSSMLRSGISNESFASNPNQVTPITEGSRTYSDVRVAYGVVKDGWQVYGGVNNVFDRDPPVNLFATGFGSALYEGLGRSYYVGVNYNF